MSICLKPPGSDFSPAPGEVPALKVLEAFPWGPLAAWAAEDQGAGEAESSFWRRRRNGDGEAGGAAVKAEKGNGRAGQAGLLVPVRERKKPAREGGARGEAPSAASPAWRGVGGRRRRRRKVSFLQSCLLLSGEKSGG